MGIIKGEYLRSCMANRNKKFAKSAVAIVTGLLALIQLQQKILTRGQLILCLLFLGMGAVYAVSDWFLKGSLSSVEKVGHFVLVVVAVAACLIPLEIWLEAPSFAVQIETQLAGGPNYGAGYWLGSDVPGGCLLRPVQYLMFASITNLQPHKIIVASYKIEVNGKMLPRLDVRDGAVFYLFPKAKLLGGPPSGSGLLWPHASISCGWGRILRNGPI